MNVPFAVVDLLEFRHLVSGTASIAANEDRWHSVVYLTHQFLRGHRDDGKGALPFPCVGNKPRPLGSRHSRLASPRAASPSMEGTPWIFVAAKK